MTAKTLLPSPTRRISRLLQAVTRKWMVWTLRRDPNGMWDHVERARTDSGSIGMTLAEFYFLYRFVLRRKPRHILELGSGISSIVLGFAALRLEQAGSPCSISTYEESPAYAADLSPVVPDAIRSVVNFHVQTPSVRKLDGGWASVSFPEKAPHPYDLVIVDGPQYVDSQEVDGATRRCFDGDALDVLAWQPGPFCVLVDGRRQTVDALRVLAPFGRRRTGRVIPSSLAWPPLASRLGRTPLRRLFPHTFHVWEVPGVGGR